MSDNLDRTQYEVQIKCPNKPDEWRKYYEPCETMTQASILMLRASNMYPGNTFRVIPVVAYERL